MVDRASIIRSAVNKVPRLGLSTQDGVNALTADAASTTNVLVDTSAAPPLPSSVSLYKNWYVYRPAAANAEDTVKMVAQFDPVNQGWRIADTAYTVAPDSERYLILRDHPNLWNRAVNEALTNLLSFPRFDEFSPVSDTRRIYAIAGAPISVTDLTRLSQIWGLEYHDENDTSNEEDWRPWADGVRTWEPFEDAGTFSIDFGRGQKPGTSDQFRLITMQPYATLTDETTTTNVEEEWAAYAVLTVMADWLADKDNPADEWNNVGRMYRPMYTDRRRAVLGKYAYRQVIRPAQRFGGVRVGGRAGR